MRNFTHTQISLERVINVMSFVGFRLMSCSDEIIIGIMLKFKPQILNYSPRTGPAVMLKKNNFIQPQERLENFSV